MGDPGGGGGGYYSAFEAPSGHIALRHKKRALLVNRLSSNTTRGGGGGSPLKRSRTVSSSPNKSNNNKIRKRPFTFGPLPPPPPEDVVDFAQEESPILKLFAASNSSSAAAKGSPTTFSSAFSAIHSTSSHPQTEHTTPDPVSYLDFLQTPPPPSKLLLSSQGGQENTKKKKRQQLTPVPSLTSSSTVTKPINPFQLGGTQKSSSNKPVARINLRDRFADEVDSFGGKREETDWFCSLPLDWSLKTRLSIVSPSTPFGFNCGGLKSSEESSGTSAFARCIDIHPKSTSSSSSSSFTKPSLISGGGASNDSSGCSSSSSPSLSASSSSSPLIGGCGSSQLDTSLGAQFHQTCLYWQHPTLPGVDLFPRDYHSYAHQQQQPTTFSFSHSSAGSGGNASTTPLGGIRMEQKVLDVMFLEWVDAFRSVFQLLRTRQCPYFYVCTSTLTCLFSAAGTQGADVLQAYITPSSKGFRDALNQEGIEFSTPCSTQAPQDGPEAGGTETPSMDKRSWEFRTQKKKKGRKDKESEDEQEPDKWLDEMGISQDVSLSSFSSKKTSPASTTEEKNKSSLVVIRGTATLAFFNLLINSKSLLVAGSGPWAGIPPTLLSPIAFHGATLKQVKVKQSRSRVNKESNNGEEGGSYSYIIDMVGPILPHVLHMLTPVLKKTVGDFKIRITPLNSTTNLNLNSRYTQRVVQTNAFELQNLSDCGLAKGILEAFCRPDNVDTITSALECKSGLFRWS